MDPVLRLQRQAGNQAVQRLLRSRGIQAKSAISQPGDGDEREAEQGAKLSRKCACGGAGKHECAECSKKQPASGFALKESRSVIDACKGPKSRFPDSYGETVCQFPGTIVSEVTTSGCNKACTELHESIHRADMKPCCEQANVEYMFAKNAAEKAKVVSTYCDWQAAAQATLECRAYSQSNPCLDRTMAEKKCESDTLTSEEKECCGELKLARKDGEHFSQQFCPSAAATVPQCPFGPGGP
jgi:hypothetical protein